MGNTEYLAWWAHLMADHPRGWWHHCQHEAKRLAAEIPKEHGDLPRLLKEQAKGAASMSPAP